MQAFNLSYVYTVLDINECSAGIDNCDQNCVDVEGSFQCVCGDGYLLLEDSHTCQGCVLPGVSCVELIISLVSC